MNNRKRLLSLLLAAALVMLTACTGGKAKPAGGFDLAVSIASEPQTIDPQLNSALDSGTMIHHIFEGLLKWVDDGSGNAVLAAGQAETWDKTPNADGTVTYTFHLRENIRWSDGQSVTAGDFEYAWRRLVSPETGADYANMLDMLAGYRGVHHGYDAKGAIADYDGAQPVRYDDIASLGVKAQDERTLVVTLAYDCPYFEEVCAFPAVMPVRKDAVEDNGQWTFRPETYLSNGPYRMSEWVHNSHIKLVKNENYYNAAVIGPDNITFRLTDDANAALNAFNRGELQFILELPPDEIAGYLANGKLNVDEYLGTYFVCFQNEKPPFNDARVREAFSLAIDRTYIVRQIMQAGQTPAGAFVPYAMHDASAENEDFRTVGGNYYDPSEEGYAANCERARELLAAAGYPDGKGFPVVEYLYNTSANHKAIGEALQQMWQKELGVAVTLNNQEWGAFLQTRKTGNYALARHAWTADYNDPMCFLDLWVSGSGNNDAKYASSEYDDLIRAAKATSDQTERMDLMHQAEERLIGKDHALAPIFFYTRTYLLDEKIQGLVYTPLGYYLFMYTGKA